MKKYTLVSALLLSLVTPVTYADLLGVSDAALLANAIQQLKQLNTTHCNKPTAMHNNN